ncbi:MAG TPA: hypothetical protein VF572_04925 [Candidatus Saccharimonadales bacterium]|jgi:hypothetical protein
MTDQWRPRIGGANQHPAKIALIGAGVLSIATVGIQGYRHLEDDNCAMLVATGDYRGAIACGLENAADEASEALKRKLAGIVGFEFEEESGGSASGIGLKRERIISDELNVSFGVASIDMAGTGEFAFNGDFWHDMPFRDDAKLFYNPGNARTTEVTGMPCFNFGSYKTSIDNDKNARQLSQALSKNKSKVPYNVTFDKNGKSISKIAINAGTLDLCMAHVAQTQANEDLWNNNDYKNVGTFGTNERNFYSYTMKKLITMAALAQSCPEQQLDMEQVKTKLAQVAQGQIAAKLGEQELVAAAYKAGRVEVNVDPPQARQDFWHAEYERERNGLNDLSIVPKHLEVEKINIGGIEPRRCDMGTATMKKAG